jgi:hypothetical protein
MLPPSLAIAWMLWRRHRLGLLLGLAYLGAAGIVAAVLPREHLEPWGIQAVFGVDVTLMVLFALYLLSVFALNDGDLAGRESCFPASLFTLPVRTGALAGWPLAYAAATVSLLWLAMAGFILRPWGLPVPLWWPAVLTAAGVAWVQMLLWLPFGLPWLRVLVASVVLPPGLMLAVNYSVEARVSEGFLVGLFSGLAAVAWVGAYRGVRRARHGDVPNWATLFRPLCWPAQLLPGRSRPFGSATGAQIWFEWRRTGNSLPIMTALVLPVVLLPLVLLGKNDAIPISGTLVTTLLLPVFFAGIAGTTVSGKHPWVKDYYGVPAFTATLPMATAGMVGAKLQAAAVSVLAAWALVALVVPAAVVLTGNSEEVAGWWRQAVHAQHPVRIIAGMVAALALLLLWTWKRQVDSLFLGLTGRKWVIHVSLLSWMGGFTALVIAFTWIAHHPEVHERLREVVPWVLVLVTLARVVVTGLAVRLSLRWGLVAPRTVASSMAAWVMLAAALCGLLAWSVPPDFVPWYYLVFGVFWCFPMAHLAATPLALAWNRHR